MTFEDFKYGASVSGLNAFEVAKCANLGFDKLGDETPRAFIATGNALPWLQPPLPHVLGLSSGKKILANIMESCAEGYGPVGKRSVLSPTPPELLLSSLNSGLLL